MNLATAIIVGAAACAIFGSVWKLTRGIFNVAVDLRDNKNATLRNTEALKELSATVDGRMTRIEAWIKNHDRGKS